MDDSRVSSLIKINKKNVRTEKHGNAEDDPGFGSFRQFSHPVCHVLVSHV